MRIAMPDTCPHCGTRLPAVVDAFCPECREDLSAPPARAAAPQPAHAENMERNWGRYQLLGFLLLALLCGVIGLVNALRGDQDEALRVGFGSVSFWLLCA